MNEYRFFNPSQPQTLQIGVMLCYVNAVFGLIFGSTFGPLIAIGLGIGGFGIANEKKWGYGVAVAAAAIQVFIFVALFGFRVLTEFDLLVPFMFDAALLLLLVHPMSRDYQRIWFR